MSSCSSFLLLGNYSFSSKQKRSAKEEHSHEKKLSANADRVRLAKRNKFLKNEGSEGAEENLSTSFNEDTYLLV